MVARKVESTNFMDGTQWLGRLSKRISCAQYGAGADMFGTGTNGTTVDYSQGFDRTGTRCVACPHDTYHESESRSGNGTGRPNNLIWIIDN